MEKQKHIFVCSLIFIAIICLTIMNIKYDRLSRYPYQEKEAREIIDKYLSDEEIEYIIEDDVLNVWRKTKQHSGITYSFFRKYYKGKKKAVAYRLKNVVLYDKPLSLEDIGVSCAPQSYCYLSMPG